MSASHRIDKIQKSLSLSRNHATGNLTRRPQIQVSGVVPAAAGEKVERPSSVFETFQLKYNLDLGSPLWRRLFHRWVYLPFNRFCFLKLNLIPPDHLVCGNCGSVKSKTGKLGWLERQGVFSQQWRAEQEAARYPFGGVEPLAFDTGEQDWTCNPRSIFPNSVARKRYEKNSHATVGVDVTALQKLANTLALSERGKSSETT